MLYLSFKKVKTDQNTAVLVVTSALHRDRLSHASILPWDILNKDLQRPLKLLINHPQTRPDAPRSEGGDVPVDNHPWASAASVIKSGGGGVKAESFQTVVEMEAIISVTKRKVGKKKRIMAELIF